MEFSLVVISQNIVQVSRDVTREWNLRNPSEKKKLSWPEYRESAYGFLTRDGGGTPGLRDLEARDRRRWRLVDSDRDGRLDRGEYRAFLHPETEERLGDVVVTELVEDMDSDGDGLVSEQEYLEDRGWEGEERERWRKEFRTNIDSNNDGLLDREEVRAWALPAPDEHHRAEAEHLVEKADRDGDGELSKGEVLGEAKLFLGSQATDYGEGLLSHVEL